jgi:hypothetical protein
MLYYRRYGIALPQGESFSEALASIFEAVERSGIAIAPLRFLFDDAPGGASCARILERIPVGDDIAGEALVDGAGQAAIHAVAGPAGFNEPHVQFRESRDNVGLYEICIQTLRGDAVAIL